MKKGVSVREATRLVMAQAALVATEIIPLSKALGRTARTAVCVPSALPPFASSAMDGFAVRWDDCQVLPATLPVAGTIPAGAVPTLTIESGTCAAIMTGAVMPEGADTVIPVEWTTRLETRTVRIERAVRAGMYVRPAGQDAEKGEAVVEAGTVLTPGRIGMAAAAGAEELCVARRPTVGLVITGDELSREPGPLPLGKIRDINGPGLSAQVHEAGATVSGVHYAADNPGQTEAALEGALKVCDVLCVSGGVSMGEHDVVKDVLHRMGLAMLFWRVRQRPGGPLAFGVLDGRPVFGLPGNPVSAAVCFDQYVRPLIASMLGRPSATRPRLRAVLRAPTPKKPGLHFYTRGIYAQGKGGGLEVRDTGPQGSNLYSSMARANCFIHLPEEMDAAPVGTRVSIEPFSGTHW